MEKLKVKLSEIIIGIESQSNEIDTYFNAITGTVVHITYEDYFAAESDENLDEYPKWQQESIMNAKAIMSEANYIYPLPSRYDVNTYDLMVRFSLSIEDQQISDDLYNTLKGNGAFRRFKNKIRTYGIEMQWYAYRDKKIKAIAIEWCEANGIDYYE